MTAWCRSAWPRAGGWVHNGSTVHRITSGERCAQGIASEWTRMASWHGAGVAGAATATHRAGSPHASHHHHRLPATSTGVTRTSPASVAVCRQPPGTYPPGAPRPDLAACGTHASCHWNVLRTPGARPDGAVVGAATARRQPPEQAPHPPQQASQRPCNRAAPLLLLLLVHLVRVFSGDGRPGSPGRGVLRVDGGHCQHCTGAGRGVEMWLPELCGVVRCDGGGGGGDGGGGNVPPPRPCGAQAPTPVP